MAKNCALILVARLPTPKSTVPNPRSAVPNPKGTVPNPRGAVPNLRGAVPNLYNQLYGRIPTTNDQLNKSNPKQPSCKKRVRPSERLW